LKKNQHILIVLSVIIACICMGIVDAIIEPGYLVKSIIKVLLFLGMPIVYALFSKDGNIRKVITPDRKGILLATVVGFAVYAIVLSAYFIFRNIFDFSALTTSLTTTTGVNKQNFIWVALYISFINSFLEEYFFRGFAFLTLKKQTGRMVAYCFSATMFAFYHVAIMIGWFHYLVVILALIGLFIGGLIFDWLDEKYNNIYLSWLVHMFANFATNTIGFILFKG